MQGAHRPLRPLWELPELLKSPKCNQELLLIYCTNDNSVNQNSVAITGFWGRAVKWQIPKHTHLWNQPRSSALLYLHQAVRTIPVLQMFSRAKGDGDDSQYDSAFCADWSIAHAPQFPEQSEIPRAALQHLVPFERQSRSGCVICFMCKYTSRADVKTSSRCSYKTADPVLHITCQREGGVLLPSTLHDLTDSQHSRTHTHTLVRALMCWFGASNG